MSEVLFMCKLGVLSTLKSSEFFENEWMNSYIGLEHIIHLISVNYYQAKKCSKLQVSFSKFLPFVVIGHKNDLSNVVASSFMISSDHWCCSMSYYMYPYSGQRPSSGYLILCIVCHKLVSSFELIKFYVLWQVSIF